MYYILLPKQEILDLLLHENVILYESDMIVFITTVPKDACIVFSYLNQLPPSLLMKAMLFLEQIPMESKNLFQMKTTETLPPFYKKYDDAKYNDTNVYPYTYIFPEGIVNMQPTFEMQQAYVNKYFATDANIIQEIRHILGPTFI